MDSLLTNSGGVEVSESVQISNLFVLFELNMSEITQLEFKNSSIILQDAVKKLESARIAITHTIIASH